MLLAKSKGGMGVRTSLANNVGRQRLQYDSQSVISTGYGHIIAVEIQLHGELN